MSHLPLRHHPKMKTSNMKVTEELFYTGQYKVDLVPKHHVMMSWMWTVGKKVQLCAVSTLLVCVEVKTSCFSCCDPRVCRLVGTKISCWQERKFLPLLEFWTLDFQPLVTLLTELFEGGAWNGFCGTLYSYAPHNDISVNDRLHTRWWSHNII